MESEAAGMALSDAAEPVLATEEPPILTPSPSRRESSAWYLNPLYMAGAGAGVLLFGIAGWVLLGRRREPVFAGAEPGLVTGDSLAARMLAGSDDAEEKPEESAHEAPGFDPLSGVEVEELSEAVAVIEDETVLRAAMDANPDDPELRLELIEFYFGIADRDKFQEEAERLFADLGDPLDSRWLKIAELGRQLVPENPLFGTPADEDEDEATADKDLEFLEFDLEDELEGVQSTDTHTSKAEPAPGETRAAQPEPEAEPEAKPEAEPEPEPTVESDEDTLLAGGIGAGLANEDMPPGDITQDLAAEIEKELGLDLEAAAEEARAATEETADEGEVEVEVDDFEPLSLGTQERGEAATDEPGDKPAVEPQAPVEPAGAAPEEVDELPDLEFEADAPVDSLGDTPAGPEAPAPAPADEPELAAEGLGLELMSLEEKGATVAKPEEGNGEIEVAKTDTVAATGDVEEEEDLDVEESVATKLDLARAYVDMGDPESARNMIEEVISEGSPQQKAEAQSLLGRI
ncbi:MAG: hypothetical protein E2O56_00045 [Gammaproteobacteria bacterium]|nr:MAG: hypothetical protein E2O56_00045 [Gammaproteobacteria bacterium]